MAQADPQDNRNYAIRPIRIPHLAFRIAQRGTDISTPHGQRAEALNFTFCYLDDIVASLSE